MIKKISDTLVDNRRIAILLLVFLMLGVGAGVTHLEEEVTFDSFEIGVEEEEKLDYVESNFSTGPSNQTITQIIVRDENVLDKETLVRTLELQKEIRQNDTVAPTLSEDRKTVGIANIVARSVIRFQNPSATSPTLEEQIDMLESMDESEIDGVVERLLDGKNDGVFAFMPTDYEAGTANASSTMVVVFQTAKIKPTAANIPDGIVDSQTAIQDLSPDNAIVVGDGILTHEMEQSRKDTMSIVGPLALIFVLLTLVLVYRDFLDIALSLLGIILVQVWTFGTLGWIGIAFNPVLIAVPVLLIGLSIDYGIHVFMRYRETRNGDIAESMKSSLGSVGGALVLVTVTTVVGFLSNLASPMQPIRELGIISAIGIVGALVVFGLLIPPIKTELDSLLEGFGFDRHKQAMGTNAKGPTPRLLSVGSKAARKAPFVVLVGVLVLTAVTTLGASQVSTSFEPEDNIPGEAPEWTENLPEPLEPGEYNAKQNLRFVNDNFVRHGSQVEILVEGDITKSGMLESVAEAEKKAAKQDTAVVLANGEARTESPFTVMKRVADRNQEFAEAYRASDTDGDGVPDKNLESLYDKLYEVAPEEAKSVVHRNDGDGQYEAFRMSVSVDDGAEGSKIIDEMRSVAGVLEGEERTVTATGDPIINQMIQDYLLENVLTSLVITIAIVIALLMFVYHVVHGSATLGIVTLTPVILVVSWIIGTMYVLGYPLSVLTTVVASITIGIGIDYSIHISERFQEELDDSRSVGEAISTTVRGTGSALLGSATTTAIGFGVLAFALNPMLQQFGTITAVMIVYAFLGSVLVLPSLLVLWYRYLGPRPERTGTEEGSGVEKASSAD